MLKILTSSNTHKNIRLLHNKNHILPNFKTTYRFSSYSEEDLKKAQQYVIQTLRTRSWVDYMISSYLPKSARNAYCAIQLFNLQMTRISDNIKQPSLGLGRLQFWRGTINKIYNSEKPNAQPISITLDHACHHNPLTKGYFQRIINAKAQQISNRNLDNMDQMLKLCQDNYSTLIALQFQLLRIQIQPQYEQLITKMGHSIGICMYLRRVPYGLRNYRFLVPLDILTKYNVQPTKIWDRVHGKPSQDFFDAVLEIASYSKRQFQDAVKIFENLTKQQKIHPQAFRAFLKGIQIQEYLKDLQKYNFNLFDSNVIKGSPMSLPLKFYKAARKHRFYSIGKID